MSQQRSLEQERAKAAWQGVVDVRDHNAAPKKEYGSLARSAPADIQTNGLGQVLAFWKAKGKDEHKALGQQVSGWVKSQLKFTNPDLLDWIVNSAGTDEYRRATAEAMAFLSWLKRFAEAELG